MTDEKILALGYDFYNKHLLHGQNEDISFYKNIIKEYKPKNVLIVGAGTGRIAIPLSKYTNIEALDICNERLDILNDKDNSITTYVGDICNYKSNKKYDIIIIPYSTIQLLGSYNNIKNALDNCSDLLVSEGLLIFDVSESFNTKTDTEYYHLFSDYCQELDSNIAVYCESKRFKRYIKFNTYFYVEKNKRTVVEIEKYLYYNALKLKKIVNNRFELKKIVNGYKKDFFLHKHLYFCRKK